jgi:predicted Zn-ribbon and HTH transcriptional regulator
MLELQDIMRQFGAAYRLKYILSTVQAKAMNAIIACRTAVLGGHIDRCDECGYEQHSYNSCRNRHCPKCQTFAKEEWIDRQKQNLINRRYFHVVFTVPAELRPIFHQNQRTMYGLLFKAASETMLELCADKKYLGAKPGITAVLHTWGQNLSYHPHLHCIVTGGGLTELGTWKDSRKKFFLPVKVLSKKFRGKLLYLLQQENLQFAGGLDHLNDKVNFGALLKNLYNTEWVVYCKKPFGNAQKVIDYLGRYTHRVAVSNNRLISMTDGQVAFRWRDYRDGNKQKVMTLTAEEFIRRFLLHILPSGFRKIRHFGLFASRGKGKRLTLCKRLTGTRFAISRRESTLERLIRILGADFNLCPRCHSGHLSRASPWAKN